MQLVRESINSGLHFDLDKLNSEKQALEKESEAEGFWNNSKAALQVISRLNYCRDILGKYEKISSNCIMRVEFTRE